ncbi:MAG: LLM class flavin-dependent oxidoreductase [Xenophilus sp.]
MEVYWYIFYVDGQYPWNPDKTRPVDRRYLKSLATAIDSGGYHGALVATGAGGGWDPWVISAHLAAHTERLRFLIAVHPSLLSPTLLAKQAVTLDHLSGGRVEINVVNGHAGLEAGGVHLQHDERYAHGDEYLGVLRRLLAAPGEGIDHKGKYLDIRGARGVGPAIQSPYPPLWVGGSSPVAMELAAKHADVYASWAEPLDKHAAHLSEFRQHAERAGRRVETAMTAHVLIRDTEEQAWAEADTMLKYATQESVDNLHRVLKAGQSVGQQRALSLLDGRLPRHARELEISPNVWTGYGLLRIGSSLAFVGTARQVADRLIEYHEAGVDKFILSHHPLPDEAHRVADELLPLLPLKPVQPLQEAANRQVRTFNNQVNGLGAGK